MANDSVLVPYRNSTSGAVCPAMRVACANISTIATTSSALTTPAGPPAGVRKQNVTASATS
ncbi:hypothetical protein [Actinomadura keratinilytica]|jgi:hypothetical protein|uniref:hypothetical protein n=1 Tax=Actinomadura keratinilytica TaxID=547461 RepID=UPI0031ECCD7E